MNSLILLTNTTYQYSNTTYQFTKTTHQFTNTTYQYDTAAPKGGFGYLAGHDIKRPDGAYKFSLRKQQPQGPPNASANASAKSPSLHQVRAFAALNRLYLPEYKSKRELARGLEEAVHAMLHGKAAHAAGDEAPRGGSTLMNGLECQLVEAPPSHMFTIFE